MHGHRRRKAAHRHVLCQARQYPRHHSQAARRALPVPEDGDGQAVPSAHEVSLGRRRKPEAGRDHRERHQPRNPGYRLHRIGRMPGCPHRQAPRREREGTGAGTEDCYLHARPCQRVQRAVSSQLLYPGYSSRGIER
ncbi:Uncharacterised protein [Segatella copri]|nr:Uncharacterised protein [Segatella copri]